MSFNVDSGVKVSNYEENVGPSQKTEEEKHVSNGHAFKSNLDVVETSAEELTAKTKNSASEVLKGFSESVKGFFDGIGQSITEKFNKVCEYKFKENLTKNLSNVQEHLSKAGEQIIEAKEKIKTGFQEIYKSAPDVPSRGELKDKLMTTYKKCSHHIEDAKEKISSVIKETPEKVGARIEEAKDMLDHAKFKVKSEFRSIEIDVGSAQVKLEGQLKELSGKISDKLTQAKDSLELAKDTFERAIKNSPKENEEASEMPSIDTARRASQVANTHIRDKELESEEATTESSRPSTSLNEPHELSDSEKEMYLSKFKGLEKKLEELSQKAETHKLSLSKEGTFDIQKREIGLESKRGSSKNARDTAIEVNELLNTLVEQNCLTKEDQSKLLKSLKSKLESELKPTFDNYPDVGVQFNAIFSKIENAECPNEIILSYADRLLQRLGETPLSLNELHLSLLEPHPDQESLQKGFVLGGPALKLTKPDDMASLLDKMIEVFKGKDIFGGKKQIASEEDKGKLEKGAANLFQRLAERGVVDLNNPKVKELLDLFKNSKDPSIKALVEQYTNPSVEQPEPSTTNPVQSESVNSETPPTISAKLQQIAKGSNIEIGGMEKRARTAFIVNFAKDLTSIEAEFFKTIEASEFDNQAWMKKDNKTTAPNIIKYTDHFNQTSNFIKNELLKIEDLKERQRLAQAFLEVADEMVSGPPPRNYSSAQAIVAAFNSSAISRLMNEPNKLLNESGVKLFQKLNQLFHPTNNMRNYREAVKQNQANHISQIPYLGRHLIDLVGVDEGNPDRLEGGAINIKKLKMQADMHALMEEMQSDLKASSELSMPDLSQAISSAPNDEDKMYERSLQIKPRSRAKTN